MRAEETVERGRGGQEEAEASAAAGRRRDRGREAIDTCAARAGGKGGWAMDYTSRRARIAEGGAAERLNL